MDVIVGIVIVYFALIIFPLMLKLFGLGVIADPFIKLINNILLLPLRLVAAALLMEHPRHATSSANIRSPSARAPPEDVVTS